MPLWVTLQLKSTPTFGAQLPEIRASHRFRPSLLTSRGHPRNAMWQQCFSKQAAIPGTLVPKRQRVCLQRSPAPRPRQHPPPLLWSVPPLPHSTAMRSVGSTSVSSFKEWPLPQAWTIRRSHWPEDRNKDEKVLRFVQWESISGPSWKIFFLEVEERNSWI